MAHYSVTGAVRVACRSLTGQTGGLRRSIDCQGLPRRGYARTLSSCGSAGGRTSWAGEMPGSADGARELRHVSSAPGATADGIAATKS